MHFDGTVGAESVEVIWVMLAFVLNEKTKTKSWIKWGFTSSIIIQAYLKASI